MVQRIKLAERHKQKAKQLRIYGRLMKAIENYVRRLTPGQYMNSREFINLYNQIMITINNSSWRVAICKGFNWKKDDPEYIPNKEERINFWIKIANS